MSPYRRAGTPSATDRNLNLLAGRAGSGSQPGDADVPLGRRDREEPD
jgi:hypothetical protein